MQSIRFAFLIKSPLSQPKFRLTECPNLSRRYDICGLNVFNCDANIAISKAELIDSFAESSDDGISAALTTPNVDPDTIGFRNATFAWHKQFSATPGSGRRNFHLRIENDLFFQRGKITLIVGPTGAYPNHPLASCLSKRIAAHVYLTTL